MKQVITLLLLLTTLSAKDLIIVVGGAQESHCKVKRLAEQLCDSSFDAVAVKFHSRQGIPNSAKKLKRNVEKMALQNYENIHFYAFTLGGVVLKQTLDSLSFTPKRIVFIESPIENNISAIAQKTIPRWIMRIGVGKAVMELPSFKQIDLPTGIESGLFITIGINKLAKKVQKRAIKKYSDLPLSEESLSPVQYGKGFQDYCYSTIDHSELYEKPELYKHILLTFFKTGTFGESADRSLRDDSFYFFPDIQ